MYLIFFYSCVGTINKLFVFYRCLRLTIPSYGTAFLDFYRQSDFPLFKMLASLLHVGTSVMEGLQEATKKKYLIMLDFRELKTSTLKNVLDSVSVTAFRIN